MAGGALPERPNAPAVLIVSGLLTEWWWYAPVRQRIERRTGSRADIARIWWWQWMAAGFLGPGGPASIVSGAIDRLHEESGAPILVVAHSAGGILARLAVASVPYPGTRPARRDQIGALVTLGSPHLATAFGGTLGRHGLRAIRFLQHLDRLPGPPDPVRTLVVGGWLMDDPPDAHHPPTPRHSFSATCYRALVGSAGPSRTGDGLVPQDIAMLPERAERRRLRAPGFAHAPFLGAPWYLEDRGIDAWWADALALWRGG
jgi:hypothetical protein